MVQISQSGKTIILLEIKDHIINVRLLQGARITLEEMVRLVEKRIEISEGRNLPMILVDGGIISIDKASRDYFLAEQNLRGLTAIALVSGTAFGRSLFKFFLGRTTIGIPCKIFTDLEESLLWLQAPE